MQKVIGRYQPEIFAIFRIVVGFMFMMHGAQKLFGWFGGQKVPLSSMAGAAGAIEFVCGLMILVGLFGSVAAFIASGEMAVAYFLAHQPRGTFPIQNEGELAALYAFVFLFIAAHGSGIWSVDNSLRPSRRSDEMGPVLHRRAS
jgi:putative oxidoreductase